MDGDGDFPLIVRAVLHRDRIGHGLLLTYYAVSAIVVIVSCALQPADGAIIIGVSFGIGVLLLIGVSVANRRACKPLRAGWPRLTEFHPREEPSGQEPQTRQARARPHSGPGGVSFVVALLLIGPAGGIATAAGDAARASATVQVNVLDCYYAGHLGGEVCTAQWQADGRSYHGTIDWASVPGTQQGRYNPANPGVVYSDSDPYLTTYTLILGTLLVLLAPLMALLYVLYRRHSRLPYLARLEKALSDAERDGAPAQSPRADIPRARTRRRPGDYVLLGFFALLLLALLGTIGVDIVEAALRNSGS